jgi:hypothetical protein
MTFHVPDNDAELAKAQLALIGAYRELFENHPAGRMVLTDLLREGGVLSISFQPGDPHATAFNDGKRAMALHVMERLRWSEGQLLQLARAHGGPDFDPIPPDAGEDQPDDAGAVF